MGRIRHHARFAGIVYGTIGGERCAREGEEGGGEDGEKHCVGVCRRREILRQ
jgi:hypothetical protein